MKSKEALQALVDKFLSGHHSPEELEELLRYFAIQDGNEAQLKEIITAYVSSPEQFDEATLTRAENITRETDQYLQELIHKRQPIVRSVIHWKRYLTVAVISFSLLAAGVWLYLNSQETKNSEQLTSHYGDDVLPGGNRATLLLSDGTSIALDEAKQGIVAKGEQVVYDDGETVSDGIPAAEYATLTTPRGGQYQITLSDGSKVWLNAESSLAYPTEFTGKQRKVSLTGEGYFEVVKNTESPFIVESEGQSVEVLGTVFNVNSYIGGTKPTTTLLFGSVKVKADSKSSVQLKPGQQSIVELSGIKVKEVDATEIVAWKDGLISAASASLIEVIPQVERWYDVDFKLSDHLRNKERAYISIDRSENLSSVLRALEHTYGIQFTVQGREVVAKE